MIIAQRYLDAIEQTIYEGHPGNSWTTVYNGQLDQQLMGWAFKALCARYPILRGQIRRRDGQRYRLEVHDDYWPKFQIIEGDRAAWVEEVKFVRQLTDVLVRLMLVESGTHGYLVFAIDHGITDAHGVFAYVNELWKLYAEAVSGFRLELKQSRRLASPPSEILRQRWYRMAGGGVDQQDGSAVTTEVRAGQKDVISFSEDTTSRIVAASRAANVGIGSLLAALTACALRARKSSTSPVPMVLSAGVDQRQSVDPPIGVLETTHLVSLRKVTLEVGKNADPPQIARDFRRRLNEMYGERYEQLLIDNESGEGLRSRWIREIASCDVRLNSVGVVPMFDHPPNIEIVDFVELGFYPDGRTDDTLPVLGHSCGLSVYTFAGKLRVALSAPEGLYDELSSEIEKKMIEWASSVRPLAGK